MGYKQVGKSNGSTTDSANVEEFPSAIADKTHLANLITSLKSELASANALLKSKEHDHNEANEQVTRFKDDLGEANTRMASLEKQCENYRQTVSIFDGFFLSSMRIAMRVNCDFYAFFSQIKLMEETIETHSDTIQRLEEHQSVLKSVSL